MKTKVTKSIFILFLFGTMSVLSLNLTGCASHSTKDEWMCQECGEYFKKGTGNYAGQFLSYGAPDNEDSHFCSPECACKYVQRRDNNKQ